MYDIWNPWHGCIRKSEGCENCFMYSIDKQRGQNGRNIFKVKNLFDYPLQKDKKGQYKVRSGLMLRVCMTSDFFLQEADEWRNEAWDIMQKRPDVTFILLTKRPERVMQCLPKNWDQGWDNIFFNITTENQKRADERIPLLKDLPFKHKGIIVAPFIGPVSIKKYLDMHFIEQVVAGGENYNGARPLHYDWVKQLYQECVDANVRFCFMETGTHFIKDNKLYTLSSKRTQSVMAFKSGLQWKGKPLHFNLVTPQMNLFHTSIPLYEKQWSEPCQTCGARLICNGCQKCEKCSYK